MGGVPGPRADAPMRLVMTGDERRLATMSDGCSLYTTGRATDVLGLGAIPRAELVRELAEAGATKRRGLAEGGALGRRVRTRAGRRSREICRSARRRRELGAMPWREEGRKETNNRGPRGAQGCHRLPPPLLCLLPLSSSCQSQPSPSTLNTSRRSPRRCASRTRCDRERG